MLCRFEILFGAQLRLYAVSLSYFVIPGVSFIKVRSELPIIAVTTRFPLYIGVGLSPTRVLLVYSVELVNLKL